MCCLIKLSFLITVKEVTLFRLKKERKYVWLADGKTSDMANGSSIKSKMVLGTWKDGNFRLDISGRCVVIGIVTLVAVSNQQSQGEGVVWLHNLVYLLFSKF